MYKLPDLPFKYDALESVVSEKIMKLHHDKHHAGYVKNVNDALKDTDWENKPIEEVLQNLDRLPKNIQSAVRNNGGGHANHSLFWQIMKPKQDNNKPTNNILSIIEGKFDSFDSFQDIFSQKSLTQFGSGWAWLVVKQDKSLEVYSTSNQDSPLSNGDVPILGLDVWEHAYYLDYLNDRAAYIEKWWDVVNWKRVEELFNVVH